MPRIRVIPPEEADGDLKRQYDQALRRAGRVYHVVSIQSLAPGIMEASLELYQRLMLRRNPLPRAIREMVATVTARELNCFY